MKPIFIFSTVFLFIVACTSQREAAVDDPIELESAVYENWGTPSPNGSEGMERGTDITLTFSEWPENYSPEYVVFRNRESFPAELELLDDGRAIITARIVQESGVMAEISESVFLSDRITFTRPDGDRGFLEIDQWERRNG